MDVFQASKFWLKIFNLILNNKTKNNSNFVVWNTPYIYIEFLNNIHGANF